MRFFNQVILWLYQLTPFSKVDNLFTLHLRRPKFYKPSADGKLLLNWDYEFRSGFAPYFPEEISDALINCVTTNSYEVSNFDFANIKSLSASKSFGGSWYPKINGSWFSDAASWGEAMYPSGNLSGLDDDDWEKNISYIEKVEGFPISRPISVYYFSWLGRYQASQTGGSHHTAMVLHQIKNQKRHYTRHAKVKEYSLDITAIEELSDDYLMFVTASKVNAGKISTRPVSIEQAIKEYISPKVYTFQLQKSVNKATVCIIPLKEIKIEKDDFFPWYNYQVSNGNIVPFIDLLKNTLKYCNTPYIHEVDSCYLGDPVRESDYQLRKIKSINYFSH